MKSKAKYKREIYQSTGLKWYVRVKAKNGQIVNTMSQGYERKAAAIREFDKLWSVNELQLLRNTLASIEISKNSAYQSDLARNSIALLEKIQGLIDRSGDGLPATH